MKQNHLIKNYVTIKEVLKNFKPEGSKLKDEEQGKQFIIYLQGDTSNISRSKSNIQWFKFPKINGLLGCRDKALVKKAKKNYKVEIEKQNLKTGSLHDINLDLNNFPLL